MNDPYESDIDDFHEFLKSIHSIDEFFERKRPAFRDWWVKEMTLATIEQGHSSAEDMLFALKQGEKKRFVQIRDGTASAEDR